jgi:hypothetical protein
MPSKKKKSKAAKGRKPAVGKGRTKAEENVSIKMSSRRGELSIRRCSG